MTSMEGMTAAYEGSVLISGVGRGIVVALVGSVGKSVVASCLLG